MLRRMELVDREHIKSTIPMPMPIIKEPTPSLILSISRSNQWPSKLPATRDCHTSGGVRERINSCLRLGSEPVFSPLRSERSRARVDHARQKRARTVASIRTAHERSEAGLGPRAEGVADEVVRKPARVKYSRRRGRRNRRAACTPRSESAGAQLRKR